MFRNAFLLKYLLLERSSFWRWPVWVLSETKPHTLLRLEDQTLQRFKSRCRVSSGDCLLGIRIKSNESAGSTAVAAVYYFPAILPAGNSEWIFSVISEVTGNFYLCREVQAPNRELYPAISLIGVLELSWQGIALSSHLWWELTGVSFTLCTKQNLTTNLLAVECKCLSKHFSGLLISHQIRNCTCNCVCGQLWVPPAFSCSVLALPISCLERMSHFVLISFRRREQQWAQNIIPHWREWSRKAVVHPWKQLCDLK